jgi:NAD(P)-dependent dehydrogenase (short-subunit alcohol dehydrogenase family)/acyl carrier protein
MMEPVLETFGKHVRQIQLKAPQIPYISNVTGTWIKEQEAMSPEYWVRHLRQTVRFSQGVEVLCKEPNRLLLELGPGRTLASFALKHRGKSSEPVVLTSLCHAKERGSEEAFILNTLGRLWLEGVKMDWQSFYRDEKARRVSLPTYPFEGQRYWIDPPERTVKPQHEEAYELCSNKPDIADWFYIPSWKRSLLPLSKDKRKKKWLFFMDTCSLGVELIKPLKQDGKDVTIVHAGHEFTRLSDSEYAINPRLQKDYNALWSDLKRLDKIPNCVVHLWNVTSRYSKEPGTEEVDEAQYLGFYSLLFFAQTTGEHKLTEDIEIAVLSNHLQDVTGEEKLSPEKATLLGPVTVINQEYEHIRCVSIDIVLPEKVSPYPKAIVKQLTEELTGKYSDRVIAYRGSHRWVKTFVPVRLDELERDKSILRQGGVYLITGGFGGVGFLLAKYLAENVKQARLVLIGRSALNKEREGKQTTDTGFLPTSTAFDLAQEEERQWIVQEEAQANLKWGIQEWQKHESIERYLNDLCTSYIYEYFTDNGINTEKGSAYSLKELKQKLRVIARFEKFIDFFTKVLKEEGIICQNGGQIVFIKGPDEIRSTKAILQTGQALYPEIESLVRLLEHCVAHYGKALSGEIQAISVLYPDGELNLSDLSEQNHLDVYSNRKLYIHLLVDIVCKAVKHKDSGKPFRILEIGGGNGFLTNILANHLKPFDNLEYHFTDIGKAFVLKAKRERDGFYFMKFGVLDISRDPVPQGYKKESFDIIVGLDVVHATPKIEESLGYLKTLLVSNGLLLLIETVKTQRWVDMVWGLAEGWWYFKDSHLRKDSPLLDLQTWGKVMENQGFKDVQAYPQEEQNRYMKTDYGLIIGQRKENVPPDEEKGHDRIMQIKALESFGAEVLALSVDVSDQKQMESAITRVHERFGKIHGVIHAAGIAGGGLIQFKTTDLVEAEFGPKMYGAWALHRLLKDEPLDFMVLCSALSSVTGGVGQVSYCASNLFLDALAHARAYQNTPYTVSINWDRWQGIGMALEIERIHKNLTGNELAGGMNTEQGIEAFRRILTLSPSPQLIVSTRHFKTLAKQASIFQLDRCMEELRPSEAQSRFNQERQYIAPCNEIEQTIVKVWQEELGIDKISARDNFLALGGDSLIAIKVISRLRDLLHMNLPVRSIYEESTVSDLARYIETMQWASVGDDRQEPLDDNQEIVEGTL